MYAITAGIAAIIGGLIAQTYGFKVLFIVMLIISILSFISSLFLIKKKKNKRIYGMLETQFRNYFFKANKKKGITGENLVKLLERRLDNVVYRLGFASSRKQARQLVCHRHLTVNNVLVNIPSYIVSPGDVV